MKHFRNFREAASVAFGLKQLGDAQLQRIIDYKEDFLLNGQIRNYSYSKPAH